MKVAAYQAPLLPRGSMAAVELIRKQVRRCESEGVAILCCPEAILGGLADYSSQPSDFAIDVNGGQLDSVLAPLTSRAITSIVGFTEMAGGKLYNAAAIFQNGAVAGVYRKVHPAIHKSVYEAGDKTPIFTVGGLTVGILLCNDSNFIEPARTMIKKGAAALFIPTNNGMPASHGGAELVSAARTSDMVRAREQNVSIVQADVAGRWGDLVSYGCSGIIDSGGRVLQSAPHLSETLLVAEIKVDPGEV